MQVVDMSCEVCGKRIQFALATIMLAIGAAKS